MRSMTRIYRWGPIVPAAVLVAGLIGWPGSADRLGGSGYVRAYEGQQEQPQQPDKGELQTQVGTLIVTPGNGPSLAVADFVARSAGVDAATVTFNQVLWDDLKFASVAGMVGKSLNPKSVVPDPASLKFDAWSGDPTKADYVAFVNLQDSGGMASDTYLYDVKTKHQLIASRHTGEPRRMAHEF